jgi:hypothetical protein
MGRTVWIVTCFKAVPYQEGMKSEISIGERAENMASEGGPCHEQIDTRTGWVRIDEWLLGDL